MTQRPLPVQTADRFTAHTLGVANVGQLIDEHRTLQPVSRLTAALAVAEWMTFHVNVIEVAPGEYALPPAWTQTEIGGRPYRHPQCLRVHFPAGTVLADTGCVVAIDARRAAMGSPSLSAYVTLDHQDGARLALDRLAARANDLNPYRGRALRASNAGSLHLAVIDLPGTLTRDTVVVGDEVWREIDLGLTAVRDRHHLLNAHGLGARRGVLLCGPPLEYAPRGIRINAICPGTIETPMVTRCSTPVTSTVSRPRPCSGCAVRAPASSSVSPSPSTAGTPHAEWEPFGRDYDGLTGRSQISQSYWAVYARRRVARRR